MKPLRLIIGLLLLGQLLWGMPAQAAALVAVEEHGSRAQHINLVYLSEGYTVADMSKFADDVAASVAFLFTKEPWQSYRSYCNIYRIEVASNESGCDNGATSGPGVMRDTYFNTGFTDPSVPQYLAADYTGLTRAYALLSALLPEYDIPVLLVNDAKYGGTGGQITVVSTHPLCSAVVEHELGHSVALLQDEYAENYPQYTPFEAPNVTAQTNPDLLKWNYWIDYGTPLPTPPTADYDATVGLFQGAMYRATGWYRPHNNSLMRNLNRPCGQVNSEQFVLRFYSWVSPLDGWSPAATATRSVTTLQQLSFSITPKVPDSGVALLTSWAIDGYGQYDASGNTFATYSDTLGNGPHTVSATVMDPTPLVRQDPKNVLQQSVTWKLSIFNQPPNTLVGWRATYGADLANPAHDGLPNLMKYALGVLPSAHARPDQYPSGSVTQDGSDTYLTLTVPRRTMHYDVDSIVEVSDDMVTWHSDWYDTVTLRDDASALVVRDATPCSPGARRFIRFKVVAY